MNQRKFRLGILLDSFLIPAWVYQSIDRIFNSNLVELSLLVFNENKSIEYEKVRGIYRRTITYQVFDAIDQRIFIRGDNALKIVNAENFLSGAPFI
jgi:hypothetical protein